MDTPKLAMLSLLMPRNKLAAPDAKEPKTEGVPTNHCCYLLELPPEVRLIIYDLLFPAKTVHVWIDWNVYRWRSYTPLSCVFLLRSCRTIYEEASPVFHDRTTVHFSICDEFERPLSRYHRFSSLEKLNATSFSLVNKIRLSLHTLTEPIFKDLLHHVGTWMARLNYCVDAKSIEIHFEFWSTISDEDLYWIYDALCQIEYHRELEIGTHRTGCWTTLYHGPTSRACLEKVRDDIVAKRHGWPLCMSNEAVGSLVGPRDLVIRSKALPLRRSSNMI